MNQEMLDVGFSAEDIDRAHLAGLPVPAILDLVKIYGPVAVKVITEVLFLFAKANQG